MLKDSVAFTNPITKIPVDEPAKSSKPVKAIITAVVICLILVIILILVAVGIGVGVSVGLKKGSNESPQASTPSAIIAGASTSSFIVSSNCPSTGSSICGCSAVKPSVSLSRIYHGSVAVTNSWPWVVAIYLNNNRRLCGGFLISHQHVITAAHCLVNVSVSSIQVYAGVQKLSQRGNAPSRSVASYTSHPSFSHISYVNDIGIITLSSPFDQGSTVAVCCLPSSDSSPAVGESGVIAGWGATDTDPTSPSDDLRQAVIQVQSDSSTCSVGTSSTIRFCAGASGSDACYGDSGGPFMSLINNAWTCTGLISAGSQCGTNTYYTRIAAYRSFVRDITGV